MTPAQRIAELEAEVAWLRSELALTVDMDAVQRLQDALRVTYGQGVILWALYKRRGRPLSNDQICELDFGPKAGESRSPSYLRVMICRLRKHFGDEKIRTVGWGMGSGYRLSQQGLAWLAPIVAPAEISDRAA